ncbi:MAG: hypothetical protein ACREL5_09160 [Gemmatimonadales bacterium]
MSRAPSFAAALLALVAIAHVLRVILGVSVVIGQTAIPMWFSYLGIVIAGGLSVALVHDVRSRESRTT